MPINEGTGGDTLEETLQDTNCKVHFSIHGATRQFAQAFVMCIDTQLQKDLTQYEDYMSCRKVGRYS